MHLGERNFSPLSWAPGNPPSRFLFPQLEFVALHLSFLAYLWGTKPTSLTFAEGEHETISREHLPAGSGFGCLRSTLAGGVSLRVYKGFPRGTFLWVGKHEEEFPGPAIEVSGAPGRPHRTDRREEARR